jgi:hypothetical protein
LDWGRSSNSELRDGLTKLSESLASDYLRWVHASDATPSMQPSAALAVIQLTDNDVEYLILGDCSITVLDPIERSFTLLTSTDLARLDRIAVQELAHFTEQGLSFDAAREAITATLQRHRRMMNQSNGYWIFGLEPSALEHAVHGHMSVNAGAVVILASDGFSRIWDTYRTLQPGWDVYEEIASHGLQGALGRLRTSESQDIDATRWPRLKISDDASVVVATVETGD